MLRDISQRPYRLVLFVISVFTEIGDIVKLGVMGLDIRKPDIHSAIMIVSELNKIIDETDSDAEAGWVGYLLNQAALRIRSMTVMSLSPLQITPPQLRALEVIAKEQPLTQVRLGELVNMDRSTIVHVVDHFEALDLASREADPTDRRSHALVLTKKGARALADARARAREVENDFLADLSFPERETLRGLLHKLFDPSPCPEEKKSVPRTPPPKPR